LASDIPTGVQIQLTGGKSSDSFRIHRTHQRLDSCIGQIPMTLQFHFGIMFVRSFLQSDSGNLKGKGLNTLFAANP
jgi:hypothetical protein